MLYLDSPMQIRGVHVFRDYNDKSRFYFLPGSPRLTVESGHPLFQLLIYRSAGDVAAAPKGGGFLVMTTDLGISEGKLEQVRQEISSRAGVQATLAPVPVKSGAVRVTILDSGSIGNGAAREIRFVENIVANAAPSLYGDERAAFTAELSREGATLMRAAIRGEGATPVVVVYDLQYVGLMPASDVKISINFQQSYEHLRTRSQMNTLWFKSDIDQEMESLRKSGAIKIESVTYETDSTEDSVARMTRLQTLAKELAQWSFFKPALNPGAVLATDRGTLAAYDATTDLSKIMAGLTGPAKAALTGVGASEDAGAPRRPGAAVATAAVDAPAAPAAPATPATPAAPAADAGSGPPTAVEAWNRAGRPQGAYMLRQLSQDERQTITFELRQVTAVERSIAPQGQIRMLEGAADLKGRILEVDLNDDFFKTIEGTITTTADLAAMGVASANVKLRYGTRPDGRTWKDEAEAVLKAPGDTKSYRFFVDHLNTREIEYQVVLTNRPDSAIGHNAATEESPWIPTTTRNLNINPLSFSSVLRVHIEAAMVDWTMVKQIQAHITYVDQRSGISAADTKILTKDSPSALVPIRPKDPRVRDVAVDATFFYNDGASEKLSLRHDGSEPFVINQPPDSTTMVDLTLTDIVERYKKVSVQLGRPGANPPEVKQTITLGADSVSGRWAFRRAQPRDLAYAYRVTSFMKDGSIAESEWVTTDNPLLVVGDRAPGVLTVKAVMLGSLADAGFRMAKLELSYPDAPAWADSSVEQLFQAGTADFTWRVPMQRTDATSYTYKVTWFKNDGQRVTTGPVTTKDEILLLDPLAP